MPAPRTVLYVEHAVGLGGSCVSLREMLAAFDRTRYRPVVAMVHDAPEVARFHEAGGYETFHWPGIASFDHTTAAWASVARPASWPLATGAAIGWRRSERRTLELVARVRPDLVHLSSAVLAPSARALHRARLPFVWHVREVPVRGHVGLRLAALRRALRRWPSELIFLSEVERRHWVGGGRGAVVPEFVDLARFTPGVDGRAARERLGISPEARVVLYVGGFSEIKGILPLIEALAAVRRTIPGLVCLMPGTASAPGRLVELAARWIPRATLTGRIRTAFARFGEEGVRRLPFSSDVPALVAASDVVAFPSTADHFARPVVEAGAMGKPAVASRLPMIEEQTGGGASALLVPPGDAAALAGALLAVLSDAARARALGEAGRAIALERFEARANAARVAALYDEVLRRAGAGV